MKKIKIIYVLFSLIFITSCKKALNVEQVGGVITEVQQWSNPDFIKAYVNNFYSILPAWNRSYDIGGEASNGNSINPFLKGANTSTSVYPDYVWDYTNVRSINNFFAHIETGKSVLTASDYKILKGQAYFFRAYVYYKMVKILGGVAIISSVQDASANILTLMVKRNTSLECFDFISKQLDSAALFLPTSFGGTDIGRVTKGAAMAVKGEVLLLKASPLFCKTTNAAYWTDAYNALLAAKAELDTDGYGLYTDNSLKTNENMWYKKANAAKEMVLYVRYNYPQKVNTTFQQSQIPISEASGASSTCTPTWELVQDYPMKNGMNINDANSGYDPTKFWKNRDPRFYTAIVYNGARYDFVDASPRVQWIFTGISGSDGYKASNSSGFYCRKGIDTTLGSLTEINQALDWPIIRYAEVLLNLAEAANETGHSADAPGLIIQIRKRAHIDAGNGNYGLNVLVGTNYQTTLSAIMKEREIEFAFEGKRFWDLRRRRLFSVLNSLGTLHGYGPAFNAAAASSQYGVDVTQNNSGISLQLSNLITNSPSSFDRDQFIKAISNFSVSVIDYSSTNQINIPDAYYFGPISPANILQNKNLIQNIGWDNGTFNPVIQ